MPVEKRSPQTHRGSPAAAARRPFHLRLPDVFAADKPTAIDGPDRKPLQQAIADDPVARARARLSERRFQAGQQQVTGLIEGLRDRRRKLFDRLWMASIALTALSIVALAVELIQGTHSPIGTRGAASKVDPADSPDQLTRKLQAPPAQRVSPAAVREWSNEVPDDEPVTSALYTTEEGSQPKGVWLDGRITPPDSDSELHRGGAQHDDHQSRTP